jgi:ATP-dependent helicase/nuclease subunit A
MLTERFIENFRKEKQGRHLLDYDDLEQETLELLYRKGNTPTPIAREISQRYVELMIDEYQDTNGVQDKIFAAISRDGKNLFFVGDVKQSIYGFRRAEPQIFTAKYYSYADFTKAKDGEPRKILLSDNFRSSAPILQAANDVFRLLMNKRVGDVDYGEEEALRAKGKVPSLAPGYKAVELHGIHCTKEDKGPDRTEIHYEAEFVARRIAEILKNETLPTDKEQVPTKPEDIVILMRSPAARAVIFQKAAVIISFPRHPSTCKGVGSSSGLSNPNAARYHTAAQKISAGRPFTC